MNVSKVNRPSRLFWEVLTLQSILYIQTPKGLRYTTTAKTTDGLTYIMTMEVLAVK